MNTINLIAIVVIVASVMTVGIITQPVLGKFCNPSGCKGDEGYYTIRGHHHCFSGTPGCIESEYHKH